MYGIPRSSCSPHGGSVTIALTDPAGRDGSVNASSSSKRTLRLLISLGDNCERSSRRLISEYVALRKAPASRASTIAPLPPNGSKNASSADGFDALTKRVDKSALNDPRARAFCTLLLRRKHSIIRSRSRRPTTQYSTPEPPRGVNRPQVCSVIADSKRPRTSLGSVTSWPSTFTIVRNGDFRG